MSSPNLTAWLAVVADTHPLMPVQQVHARAAELDALGAYDAIGGRLRFNGDMAAAAKARRIDPQSVAAIADAIPAPAGMGESGVARHVAAKLMAQGINPNTIWDSADTGDEDGLVEWFRQQQHGDPGPEAA